MNRLLPGPCAALMLSLALPLNAQTETAPALAQVSAAPAADVNRLRLIVPQDSARRRRVMVGALVGAMVGGIGGWLLYDHFNSCDPRGNTSYWTCEVSPRARGVLICAGLGALGGAVVGTFLRIELEPGSADTTTPRAPPPLRVRLSASVSVPSR